VEEGSGWQRGRERDERRGRRGEGMRGRGWRGRGRDLPYKRMSLYEDRIV